MHTRDVHSPDYAHPGCAHFENAKILNIRLHQRKIMFFEIILIKSENKNKFQNNKIYTKKGC